MANHRDLMIWMKDLIDHMADCHDQLQWAGDGPTQAFLADSLLGDLSQCRRLCEQLRQSQNAREDASGYGADDPSPGEVAFRGSMAFC